MATINKSDMELIVNGASFLASGGGGGVAVGVSGGAGAAGGLGFGLSAMLDATIQPGAGLVLEAVRFASRARQADIVLTGEGRLDSTTTSGKLVHAVARAARGAGAMPIALVGALGAGADAAATDDESPGPAEGGDALIVALGGNDLLRGAARIDQLYPFAGVLL